jgi:pyruvate dehydrogenase E1 component beta subunit
MSTVIVAEKPSVARDIARVLGARRKGEGCLEGNGYIVTWALGHLVQFAEPDDYGAPWSGSWSVAQLPMLPERWKLKTAPSTSSQFRIVRQLLNDARHDPIICATDAGREGEHIFRLIYEQAHCQKPVQRLWISSLTDQSIRQGLRQLRSSDAFDALAQAARARAQADWLVGMNLTRVGAAMGAAMTGLRPIVDLMFSDFFAVTWDIVANQIAKTRYMTDGQVTLPLVIRSANGAGSRFGAQHSQSVENWSMMIPGLKVVAPAFPGDVKGMLAAAIRSDDPVMFFEQKSLYATKGEVPDGEHFIELGKANVLREGKDVTIVALALMVPRALKAADMLKEQHGIDATVIDLRSLVPLDTQTILREVAKTGRLVTVEENPRLCGWGAEISSIVAEELFWDLDGPVVRITTPHIPLAAANNLEDAQLPTPERIVAGVRQLVD